jgi:hypothetical protein
MTVKEKKFPKKIIPYLHTSQTYGRFDLDGCDGPGI